MKSHFSFLLLYLTILSLQASPLAPHFTSIDKDTQNLINFKAAIFNSSLLQNWLPSQNPCTFIGVKCQETNRVSSINLNFVPLSTDFHSVATFLLTLDNLRSLSLISTNISGSISFPSESKCSSVLSSLDLSVNSLSGPISQLTSFGSCPALKSLNLSSNVLHFSVKEKSSGLTLSLESLDLSLNRISGSDVLPFILYGGCNLKFLSLKGNKVSGGMDVSTCKTLQHLDVSSNNFSSIVPSFGDCLALEHLDISTNKFSGDLGHAVGSCAQLNFLNVSTNQFSGPIPALPTGNLQFLSLGGNHFHGEIPLHLEYACTGLVVLDLSSNNLSGSVPPGFASCISLGSFDISFNNFTGELPVSTFLRMSSLQNLDLSSNGFIGDLPDSLSMLTSLKTLDLSSNYLSGSIPARLCQDPGNNLEELYLQSNLLTGYIPATLSNCSQLTALHLSFNYLTGTIPASLGSLTKLRDIKLWFNKLHGEIPLEIMNIKTLETLILDFNELTGVIPSGISNCTNLNWISLSNNRLSGEIPASIGRLSNLAILKLSNNSLFGRIPQQLGDCHSLIWLDLNTNYLNGTIPPELFKQSGNIVVNSITGKRYVYLKNQKSELCHGAGNLLEFAGIRSEELKRISTRHPCNFIRVYNDDTQTMFNDNGSMIFLDLSYNLLSGSIPKQVGSMYYLYILNLGHNNISGNIPEELGNLKGLGILDLSNNRLEGMIPQSLTDLSLLTEIDMSNNDLTGMIPATGQLETFAATSFANNSGLCGIPLPSCGSGSGSSSIPGHEKSHQQLASLVATVVMGLFSLLCVFGFIIVFLEMKKRKKKKDSTLDVYIDSYSHSGSANTEWKLTSAREALSNVNLATFEKPLWKLTFADLFQATNGFHEDTLIGSGGFGFVYRAQLKDGSVVAIKKLKHISGQGDREFIAEMETIGKIKHRNLVPLLGYCKAGEERLLVYEYMRFGSLEDVLHDQKKAGIKLNWDSRRKIAIGAARGLAFLHHSCNPHIIHRDMKLSNILLDDNLEARVSDFGMARLMSAMDTHLSVSTLAGTPGYVPPEYCLSFRCSTKGDVYSYGVVLLELVTGKKPTDSSDFGDNNNLVGWVKLHAKLKITDVFDPALMKEDPNLEVELLQHLKIACLCLHDQPCRRPTMLQIMAMFKEIQAGSGLSSESTIVNEDEGFSPVEMADMSIEEENLPTSLTTSCM
ncbi:hypothetical protein K2173_005238 [Erythroxylum novogranatense]|uniref:non-specific serine/threonine protein kinase n=1 Tax=Erythroxylum novogranatense TaxID=1862640 RepID=A0AAV8TUM3_9ROSI|nr:hypothetical protein K2173_005238 [Erythroxylum novogranatense]